MNLFKIAFKVVRNNSKTIYKGFGFKHLRSGKKGVYQLSRNFTFKPALVMAEDEAE